MTSISRAVRRAQSCLLALACAAAPAVHAQVWTGATNNLWTNGSNWVGGIAPANGPTTSVTFGPAPTTISFTPDVDATSTVNIMNITGAGFSFTSPSLSTIGFSGSGAALNVSQAGNTLGAMINLLSNLALDNSHTFTLAGGVTGAGTLTKTGAGTLILTGTVWDNPAIVVAAGTLQVGDGTSGPPNIVGTIATAGTLDFNIPSTQVGAPITGGGSVIVQDGSTVQNTSAFPFTYQGSTTVHGTLDVFAGSIDSNGPLLIGSTGAFLTSNGGTVGSIAGTGTLGALSQTLSAGGDDSSTTFSGFITGSGNFRKTGAGTFTIASMTNFGGLITVEAPGTLRIGNGATGPGSSNTDMVVNGALVFDTNGNFFFPGGTSGTGTVRIESGTTVNHNGTGPLSHQGSTTVIGRLNSGVVPSIDNNGPLLIGPLGDVVLNTSTVGSLSGSGFLSNFGILSAGGDDSSTTYSGVIGGPGDFRKVGSGTFTMATNSWFGGDVTVEAPGTLRIGNGTTGPGAIQALFVNGAVVFDSPSVNVNGTLTGTGTVRVEAGRTVINTSGQPFSHQGSTTVNGVLDVSLSATSIANNAPLVIGPSANFSTSTGQVGSVSGSGFLNLTSGTFTVGGDNTSTTYSGGISGSGNFRKTGSGTLTLANDSFFGGSVTIEGPGALRLGNGSAGPTNVTSMVVDGALFFNTPSMNVAGTITGGGSITVQTGSTVNLNLAAPMTHAGTTIVSGQLNGPIGVAAIDNNAPLLLSGGLVTRGGNVGSLSGSGNLQLTTDIFTTGGNNVATSFAGVLSGSGIFAKVGDGTFTLSGASPAFGGAVQVSSGTLHVSGTLGTAGVIVVTGATLTGSGSINGPINVEIGANLSPGASVGTLTTGNLAISGSLNIEVLGTTPGTQHDSVNANGTVALNGGMLVLAGSYLPSFGNTFTIINNDGADAVIGMFAGLPEGSTLPFNGATLRISYIGGTGNDVVLSVANYTVTPSAGAGGTINPSTPQGVPTGGTAVFTVTPNSGFTASVGGTCGGNLVGNTYTTNAVSADCTVVATFTSGNYTVTPSAGAGGSISPNTPQTVAPGGTAIFTVAPDPGFIASVGGSCGGNLVGNTFTTNAINANCTVAASFTAITYTVTPSAGPNGTISPSTPQTVAHGSTVSFIVAPAPGHTASVGGTCGGTHAGTSYLTNGITADCTVSATFTPADPPRMANIATRGRVLTGSDVLIAGFVIGGSGPKTVVVRARGPSLTPFGVSGVLANPQLQLFAGQTQIAFNNDWQDATNAALLQASGYAPGDPLDAAVLVTLNPGAYTAIVSGVGGTTGIAIVEVFEASAPSTPLINISTRGRVETGENVMIAGLVIQGSGPQQVVVRVRGPSLAAFGIPNLLANPLLQLAQSDQTVIGVNHNWGEAPNAGALLASGFAPSDANEAAILVTLQPGAYTAIVTGEAATSGVAIVEVFAVP